MWDGRQGFALLGSKGGGDGKPILQSKKVWQSLLFLIPSYEYDYQARSHQHGLDMLTFSFPK
jgi:hypothetical protein